MTRLSERVAVVTGAGGGIGGAIARAFAAEGAVVVLADSDAGAAELVAADIRAAGGRGETALVDVTVEREVEELFTGVADRHARVDILVNNAGSCQVKPFLELTEDDVRRMWEIHLLASFLCSRTALPSMLERGFGRIVNIVSGVDGYGASPWTSHYQAAKSAQTTLARSIALAFAKDGVTVNCLSPGLVITPLWDKLDDDYRRAFGKTAHEEIAERLADPASVPLGRPIEPQEVANVAVFLALPSSGAINGEVVNL